MAHVEELQIPGTEEVRLDWGYLLVVKFAVDNAQFFDRDNAHQLSQGSPRDVVVVHIQLRDPSALDHLHKLLSSDILDLVVLQL